MRSLLKEMNSNIQQTITNEMFIMDGVNKVFQKEIDKIRAGLLVEKEGVYKLSISALIKLEDLDIILFELLKSFGFFEVKQIIKAISSQSGKQFFSNHYQLIVDREEIIISLLENNEADIEILETETKIQIPVSMKFAESSDFSVDTNLNILDKL